MAIQIKSETWKTLAMFLIAILLVAPLTSAQTPPPIILPDSPFYGLKIALENILMALTFNEQRKAEFGLRLAEKRLIEIQRVSLKNINEQRKMEAIQRAEQERERILYRVINRVTEKNINIDISNFLDKQTTELNRIREIVSDRIKVGIDGVIEDSQRFKERMGI